MNTSKKYQVINANTDEILAGTPSDALVEASYSSNEGFVDAVYDGEIWCLTGGSVGGASTEVYVDEVSA